MRNAQLIATLKAVTVKFQCRDVIVITTDTNQRLLTTHPMSMEKPSNMTKEKDSEIAG